MLQVTAQSITILKGQSITFGCVPTPNYLIINWTMHGENIINSTRIALSPQNLQHFLTIRNAVSNNSGEYNCYTVHFSILLNKTITLNVLKGMYAIRASILR